MTGSHWHVLGAGAIGGLYAERLHRAGCDVTLLLRRPPRAPVTLVVEGPDGRSELTLPAAGAGGSGSISHLLVTTKAYDVDAAVATCAGQLAPGAAVLLLVNGMGLAPPLQQRYPGACVYSGTTTDGAYRLGPRHVRHAGTGETRLGRQGQAQPPPWFADWQRAITQCRWDADIDAALWAKLAVNCVINPLTAVHGCRNGELAARAELSEQVDLLCREISQISYAAGFTTTAQTLRRSVDAVIAGTADNRSSMLQDVAAGRATEIDAITGHLLQVAAQFGIQAHHNRRLLQEVKRLVQ